MPAWRQDSVTWGAEMNFWGAREVCGKRKFKSVDQTKKVKT